MPKLCLSFVCQPADDSDPSSAATDKNADERKVQPSGAIVKFVLTTIQKGVAGLRVSSSINQSVSAVYCLSVSQSASAVSQFAQAVNQSVSQSVRAVSQSVSQ